MKTRTPAPTFSARVRDWLNAGIATEKQLQLLGAPHPIPRSTVNDIARGLREPSLSILRRWAGALTLNETVRHACVNAIEAADSVRFGQIDLDADGDGRVTWRDAERFCMNKQDAGVRRRRHAVDIAGKGRPAPEALAADERLSQEEIRCSRAQTLIMRQLAGPCGSNSRLP